MLEEYGCVKQSIIDVDGPISTLDNLESLQIDFREPEDMSAHHWHRQIEINIPFNGAVTYLINQQKIELNEGYIGLFWATTPHKLIKIKGHPKMAIIYAPLSVFLTWNINKSLINSLINGAFIQSKENNLVSQFEAIRWHEEINSNNDAFKQLAIDEIAIFIRRFALMGWDICSEEGSGDKLITNYKGGVSKQAKVHIHNMLAYIASNHHKPITLNTIAQHVQLHPNYAISLFQKVMQQSIKEYILRMRIQHAKALLVETDRSMLDIAMTVGFQSTSRFYATFKKMVNTTPSAYRQKSK